MFSSNTSQVSEDRLYVEDVFSTYLYTGNDSTQTITNGIDLSGKGGLVWIKPRSIAKNNRIFDTARGALNELVSNNTAAQNNNADSLTSFGSTGFSLGSNVDVNSSSNIHASWTFREAPNFFDVVTYTGNGSFGRAISHSLGVAPGCILVKCTNDGTLSWRVYHRSLSIPNSLILNSTAAQASDSGYFSNTAPTSTNFYVGDSSWVNGNGKTYVAYLFAHDETSDGIIQCGSYTGDGSATGPTVTLGWEPQWLLVKNTTSTGNWQLIDNMRGMRVGSADATLQANLTAAESSDDYVSPTSTGFQITSTSTEVNSSGSDYIYIAIRRGPMKTPTTGTSVFSPTAYTATNVDNRLVDTGIVTDVAFARTRVNSSTGGFYVADRLRGNASLGTAITGAENTDADSFMTPTVIYGNSFSAMNGFGVGNDLTRRLNYSSDNEIAYAFRRAPSFMDMVCYTGTGAATTFNHNLGAVPELMIVKPRGSTGSWRVYAASLTATKYLTLNQTAAAADDSTFGYGWNKTAPTSTVFSLGTGDTNISGITYVNYLFASCPGVSKVGSYTGNGSSQTINCGFSGGARFVMIKRTDSTGDWYVWDTARGIVAGNDPHLSLNTTAAEVTTDDSVDTDSSGFVVNQDSATNINVSSATYIYLAVA